MLNAYVNYLMGIRLDDDFRYYLIDETGEDQDGRSMTSIVSTYHIERIGNNPPLIVIDTPGFGDTRGISYDVKIVDMIK